MPPMTLLTGSKITGLGFGDRFSPRKIQVVARRANFLVVNDQLHQKEIKNPTCLH